MELKSTTLQCDRIQTRPCVAWSCSCVASLATHQTSPAGSCPVAGCDDDSGLQFWSSAGCCSSLWAVPPRLRKSLIFLPISGLQALKHKRFESKLVSRYSQGGILALQRQNMSTILQTPSMERNGSGTSHHQHLNVLPSHHCIKSGNVACHSQIQSVAREALSGDWRIRLLDEAMPHLSTHSQQVTLARSSAKPKGDFMRYLVHHFPGVCECCNGKIRLYRTTDVQRDKYLKRGHPCE